ncbi:hypothetical protein GWP57_04260 [Gammaproteobacteria bacterium]|nr:hypothetical protein [Gammaproteobacteria bacterium]
MLTRTTDFNRKICRHRQRGVALPLVAIGLLAMLAVAGLALDASHALTNKTRLQNTTDAAALAAAKEYDLANDIIAANAEALSIFGINADGAGNHELNAAYDIGEITIRIEWSETLNPFINTGVGPYVRVVATDYDIDTSLSAVVGISEIGIGASAVAGPSPAIKRACNIAPLVACAKDPEDTNLFGFQPNQLEVLKAGSDPNCPADPENPEVGPGNFQLIRLDCGAGGKCVRENLAGTYDSCATIDQTVETEPGNTVGPTVMGLNTRFGVYTGAMQGTEALYPPDVVTAEPSSRLFYGKSDTSNECRIRRTDTQDLVTAETIDFSWDDYLFNIQTAQLTNIPPAGEYERRVLTIPIARCDGEDNGQSTLDVVGFGCYFILQTVEQAGNLAHIFGQFIEGCTANGTPGPDPMSGPDPYLIQLYKDPDSGDS